MKENKIPKWFAGLFLAYNSFALSFVIVKFGILDWLIPKLVPAFLGGSFFQWAWVCTLTIMCSAVVLFFIFLGVAGLVLSFAKEDKEHQKENSPTPP